MGIAKTIVEALSGEAIIYSNSLATITRNCILLRYREARTEVVLPLSELRQVRKVTITYPFLLVIATASFVIAAAALSSRDGGGAGIPFGVLGVALLAGYVLSRRATVLFIAGSELFETVEGSLTEAAELVAVIASTQKAAVREAGIISLSDREPHKITPPLEPLPDRSAQPAEQALMTQR